MKPGDIVSVIIHVLPLSHSSFRLGLGLSLFVFVIYINIGILCHLSIFKFPHDCGKVFLLDPTTGSIAFSGNAFIDSCEGYH